MKARKTTPKKKGAKRAAREPADVLVARALERLASVDRKDAAATARVLSDVFAALAAHLDSDALEESKRRTLARRVRAARQKTLGRRPKRRPAEPAPPARVQTLILPALTMPNVDAMRVVVVDGTSEPPPTAKSPSTIPPTTATETPEASWLPKTLHAAGVVEGHEPTTVVLGLLREALTAATAKRDADDETVPAARPLPVVLADLFGAFGLSRSPAPTRTDDAKEP